MANSGIDQTAKGNLRHIKINDICEWIKQSWEQISDKIIINSFKFCHISDMLNDLDISNDDNTEDSDKENVSNNDDIE